MELRQLRYFAAVGRVGTFTAAAAELRVAQPALWQQVKALERELGLPLFERWGRRVRLTRDGEEILHRVGPILESVERLRQSATDLAAGRRGRIVVACSQPHVSMFLARLIGRFHATSPDVRVELREHPPLAGLPLDDLGTGAADVGLGTEDPESLEGFAVYAANLVAAVPAGHPWAGQAEVTLQQLGAEVLLVAPYQSLSRGLLERALEAEGIKPRIGHESPSPATLVALGEQGLGVPVLADDAFATVRHGSAPLVVGRGGPIGAEVWLQWRRGAAMSSALTAFIEEATAIGGTR